MQKPNSSFVGEKGKSKALSPSLAEIFPIVQHIIADTAGWDVEEITPDSRFDEEDLGISMSDEFPIIIARIRKKLFELGDSVKLPIESVRRCETVGELLELIDDERDL